MDTLSTFFLETGALAGNIPADVVRSVVQKRNFIDPKRKAYGISPQGVLEHVSVFQKMIV